MPFDRATMQNAASRLAQAGVHVGTSSWKYEGWFEQLYDPVRYEYRGRVAKTRFQRKTYIHVNNRLEGNATATIAAMMPPG